MPTGRDERLYNQTHQERNDDRHGRKMDYQENIKQINLNPLKDLIRIQIEASTNIWSGKMPGGTFRQWQNSCNSIPVIERSRNMRGAFQNKMTRRIK